MSAIESAIGVCRGEDFNDLAYDAAAELALYARLLELARAVNKTGGVVVEMYKGRYLRDLFTELLAEIDAANGSEK